MGLGIYPAPLVFWGSCPLSPAATPGTPWIRSVGPFPGVFPLAPLGLVPGQPLAQEGGGLEESTT